MRDLLVFTSLCWHTPLLLLVIQGSNSDLHARAANLLPAVPHLQPWLLSEYPERLNS